MTSKKVATEPNDLGKYFIERANAGDVATGHAEIRKVFEQMVAVATVISPGRQQPALVSGDLALTAITLANGEVTAEIARRQPDGSWLRVADRPPLEVL